MRGIYAFFWKGVKEFFASKEAVFWTLAFPVLFGVLFAAVFGHGTNIQTTPVGIVPETQGNTTMCNIFVENMKNASVEGKKIFDVKNYTTKDYAISALKNGDIRAVIVFDGNFTENITSGLGPGKLTIIIDKRDPQGYQFVSSVLSTYITEFENIMREVRVNITLQYIDMYGNLTPEEKKYAEMWMKSFAEPLNEKYVIKVFGTTAKTVRLWYETAAIGVTFVFSGMISAASMISAEIERGTARRLFNTKTKAYEMLAGNMLVIIVVELISAFIIVLTFFAMFGDLLTLSSEVLGMLVIAALSTVSLGLLISSITKTQKAAAGAANVIAWPISFITAIFFPEYLLPDWMKCVGDYFPASALLRGVRRIVIYGKGMGDYVPQIILAIVLTAIFIVIGSLLFKWRMSPE